MDRESTGRLILFRKHKAAAGYKGPVIGIVLFAPCAVLFFRFYDLFNDPFGSEHLNAEALVALIVSPIVMLLVGAVAGWMVERVYKWLLVKRSRNGEEFYWGFFFGTIVVLPSAILAGMFCTVLSPLWCFVFLPFAGSEAVFSGDIHSIPAELATGIIILGFVPLVITMVGAFAGGLSGLTLKPVFSGAKYFIKYFRSRERETD